jgi:hypothetical protein
MKSWSFLLLAVSAAVASPTAQVGSSQFVLGEYQNYPGFNFDLSERRLVQWQNAGETVSQWMTELEKVCDTYICMEVASHLLVDSVEGPGCQVHGHVGRVRKRAGYRG